MKPVFSFLRKQDHISPPYIDDLFFMGDNYNECALNVIQTAKLRDEFLFVVYPNNSLLVPTDVIVYLGFILNSVLMAVSSTHEKAQKLKSAVIHLLSCTKPTIRMVAQVVGLIIASFHGPLHAGNA